MDLNNLRVFNALYKLKITEEEFKEIEEEQKHEERTGLCINLIKKGKIIGISHDQKHSIIIKEIKGDIKVKPKSRVLFKTLISFLDLPQEIYTLHAIAQYRALDTEIRYIADTLEELKDKICDRFIDEYPKELGGMYEEVYGAYDDRQKNKKLKVKLVEMQLKSIFWLFDENFKNFKPKVARQNIGRIIKVFQRNNRRLAIIQQNEKWNKITGAMYKWSELIKRTSYKIVTFTPRDERFNFANPNREIFLMNECDYRGKANIWLADDMFEKVSAEELKVLSERYDDEEKTGWIMLTADEYNQQSTGIRLEMMNARRKEQENKAKSKLTTAIKKQFKKGKVVRQGIELTNKSISYEGIKIENKRIGEYISQQQIHLLERPRFNEIFEGFIDFILVFEQEGNYNSKMVSKLEGKENIQIGKIKILLEKRGNLFYVNSKKINQEDLQKILKNSITYDNQKKYNEWIDYTSRVNLRLQDILNKKAVTFEQRIDKTDDNCLIKYNEDKKILLSIPIKREKGKNYIKIEKSFYRIKNINSLLNLSKEIDSIRTGYSGGGYLQRTIKLLYEAIDGISAKEIGDLIKQGSKEYKLMIERTEKEEEKRTTRSKKFIANAVRLTKAKKVDGGYFVKGLTKVTYFVDEENLEVWIIKNGKKETHLCIVDDDYSWELKDNKALRNDRIAKRLLMLSKDKKVAKEIYEKGDKMDKWWQEIQENKTGTSVVI